MFGALLGALKGIGSGVAKAGTAIGKGAWKNIKQFGEEEGDQDADDGGTGMWDRFTKMAGDFGQGAASADPNSQLGQFGTAMNKGMQVRSQIQQGRAAGRADRAIDRMRNAQYEQPIEEQPMLDTELTPPPAAAPPPAPPGTQWDEQNKKFLRLPGSVPFSY